MERIGVPPGTEIGGYRVVSALGQGGMGAVYRAVDGAEEPVALKLLHPHLAADAQARERLRREVAHLQKVRHPGVARVLDAEIEQTEAFVVTELVDGPDLAAHVRAHGPLRGQPLADLADRLREALEAVHRAQVLHRDLTPGNVLVTDDGPVLIDFGIAQAVEDARVTSTGMVVGTPGYLSPELLEGGEPDEAADWWGWASVLAFAATGRPPFGTRPLQAVLARARAGEADLEGLGPRMAGALRSALAVDPWRRSAPAQVVAELRAAAGAGDDPADASRTAVLGAEPGTEVLDGDGTRVLPGEPGTQVLAGGAARTAVLPGVQRDEDARGPGEGGTGGDQWDDDPRSWEGEEDGSWQGDEDGDDGAWDEDGHGDRDDDRDLDAVPGAADRGEFEAPEPRRRVGTVLALGAVLVAVGATRPGVALAVAVGLAVLVRSVGLDVTATHRRRFRRGQRRSDTATSVLTWPWYLLRGVLGVLPAALVAASVVVVVGGIGWWLLDTGRLVVAEPPAGEQAGELAGNAAWVTPALLALAVTAGLLTLWFGPMARATRVGARWTLGAIAPGRVGAVTAVVLALAAAAALAVLVLLGLDGSADAPTTVWWPLPGPPDLR